MGLFARQRLPRLPRKRRIRQALALSKKYFNLTKGAPAFDPADWINPGYQSGVLWAQFARYLSFNCRWDLSSFGNCYPWNVPVPPRDRWKPAVEEYNRHLKSCEQES